jgi:hypothetical protein
MGSQENSSIRWVSLLRGVKNRFGCPERLALLSNLAARGKHIIQTPLGITLSIAERRAAFDPQHPSVFARMV